MRIYLNEELWGVSRKMTLCLLCCDSCSSRDALLACLGCLSPAGKQKRAEFGVQHQWHSLAQGMCEMPAGCCAVSSAQHCVGILGKWNLCHVFLCPDNAGDLSDGSFLGSRGVRKRLLVPKCLSELQFIHFNAHPQMLHVTWSWR